MWHVKAQHVDAEIGHHIVLFHNKQTEATHVLQVIVGHHSCPLCGHVKVVDGEHNIPALISEELGNLNESHAQVVAHARKHGVPIK